MITVRDFCELCTDDSTSIEIWNGEVLKTVFNGTMHDAIFGKYADCQVESFDAPYDGVIVLNVWTKEGV